jgi:hypothetical protein
MGALKLPGQVQLVLGGSVSGTTFINTFENAGEDLILHHPGPRSLRSNLSTGSDQLIIFANSRPASFTKFCPTDYFHL